MRYLFVTVDSAGALYPQLALAQRLAARGHQVRFLSCKSQRPAISQVGFPVSTYTAGPDFDMADRDDVVQDWNGDPGAAFARCCELIWFGPAAAVAGDVLAVLATEPVDALVLDYFAFGAGIAAERLGLPTAILWHTTYGEWDSFETAGLPLINTARAELGLPADTSVYGAYRRAQRILALTTEQFAGVGPVPANLRYAGPQLPPGPRPEDASASRQGQTPTVLVSLGTSYQAQEDLLTRVVTALGGLSVRALVGTGRAVRHTGSVPANVEVLPWVEHSQVLGGVDLVITHAGLGTIMTVTAFGVPLLCLPIGRDQHRNAERVAELGIGSSHAATLGIEGLREIIGQALGNTGLRSRAREFAKATRLDGDLAVLELERLTAPA